MAMTEIYLLRLSCQAHDRCTEWLSWGYIQYSIDALRMSVDSTDPEDMSRVKEEERQWRWERTPRELKGASRRVHGVLGHPP